MICKAKQSSYVVYTTNVITCIITPSVRLYDSRGATNHPGKENKRRHHLRCGATSEPSHGHGPPLGPFPLPFSSRLVASPPLPSPSPMARPRKAKPPPPPSPPKAAAPSLAEALLLATVCMVGLPVEVQVRDGSAYAGVLHTACVDDGYGERTVTSGLSLPFSSKPARSRVSLSVAALGLMDHGIGVRDVIQQGWCGTVDAAMLVAGPVFLCIHLICLAGGSLWSLGARRMLVFVPSGWIWRRVAEIAGFGSSCDAAMHAFFC